MKTESTPKTRSASAFDRFFKISERSSSLRTEVFGGVTTFITMAYIIVVNPAILSAAGIPTGPGTVATVLAAVFGCVLMGVYANRPIAVAPYMGENAFVAFSLVAIGITWQQCLGAVFVSGVLLVIITLIGLRAWLAKSISPSMKNAFAAGIGLFLAFIGLYQAGIVTSSVSGMPAELLADAESGLLRAPAAPVKIGDLHRIETLLAVLGFVLMGTLLQRRVRGALLIGMAATGLLGALLGAGQAPVAIVTLPFVGEYSLAPVFGQLEIVSILKISFLPVFLTLFLMVFLDTLGTLVGLGASADLLDEEGNFPDVQKPMLVDALATSFAAVVGTTTSGAFIESATGIREGARTGLAALVTAGLFVLSLFFLPLFQPLQQLAYVYAPALVLVGIMMIERVKAIDFQDWTESIPAIVTVGMMVFTYNIANGLTAGLVLHPLLKLLCGRVREIHPGGVVLGVVCLAYYLFGMVH